MLMINAYKYASLTKRTFVNKTKYQRKKLVLYNTKYKIYIQGVLLPDRQTLRGYSRYEDKHY